VGIHLRTAKGTIRRYNSVHGVTEVLDLCERALPNRERAVLAMLVNGQRGINGINRSLRQGHHRWPFASGIGHATWLGAFTSIIAHFLEITSLKSPSISGGVSPRS
jgi:hypothetical protein